MNVCAIIETQLKRKKLYKIGDSIFRSWELVDNMSHCDKGCRIMVGWNGDLVTVNVIHYSKQAVLCKIEAIKGSLSMFCTFVYAANGGNERKELWKDLGLYKRHVGDASWAMLGDFNVTLEPSEHSTGGSSMTRDMCEFKDCINGIEMGDLASSGMFFTWTKNLHKAKIGDHIGILKKLDRVMGSEDFISKYSQAHAIFLPYLISDHSPVVLVMPNIVQTRKKAFKFANFVTEKSEFVDVVKGNWATEVSGCQMFKLVKKLKMLKKSLKNLAWKDGDVFDNVIKLKEDLKDVQIKIDKDTDDKALRDEESNLLLKYNEAVKIEEQMLYQKAKVKWLSLGDRNNAFFQRTLKNRNHRNRINAIHDEMGNRFEGDWVVAHIVSHFQKFLGNSIAVTRLNDLEFINKLSEAEAEYMVREVSDSEIKKAMFLIEDNKAPGPDGFSSHFYKKAWGIIGNDVCAAVREFFVSGKI